MGEKDGKEKLLNRIKELARKQQDLLAQLEQMTTETGKAHLITFLERTHRDLHRALAEQNHIITELRFRKLEGADHYGSYGRLAGQRPLRETVLDALEELHVPSAPRTIAEFVLARYGVTIPTSRFASLRRDEQSAFKNETTRQTRPAFVVPAINASTLTPIPRLVAHSAWEAERRLIGSRTLRVNHLRIMLALLDSRNRVVHATSDANVGSLAQLTSMIIRYAQTVLGAFESGNELDHTLIRNAVKAELEHIEPLDLEERQASAKRLRKLSEFYQLWGRPTVIPGDAEVRRG